MRQHQPWLAPMQPRTMRNYPRQPAACLMSASTAIDASSWLWIPAAARMTGLGALDSRCGENDGAWGLWIPAAARMSGDNEKTLAFPLQCENDGALGAPTPVILAAAGIQSPFSHRRNDDVGLQEWSRWDVDLSTRRVLAGITALAHDGAALDSRCGENDGGQLEGPGSSGTSTRRPKPPAKTAVAAQFPVPRPSGRPIAPRRCPRALCPWTRTV